MENKTNSLKKQRIWEIDAFRGVLILGVIVVHFLFDLTNVFSSGINLPPIYIFLLENGGIFFVVLSGLSVTLGTNSVKRGLIVFGCGLGVSLVTYFVGMLSPSFKSLFIVFGVLHLLGTCMITYPIFKRMPAFAVLAFGIAFVFLGYWIKSLPPSKRFVDFILGLKSVKYGSGDYFPIFPNLGWFLIGAFLGRTIYKEKRSLIPVNAAENSLIKALCFFGRHSLQIYLIHQPLIFLVLLIVL